MQKGSKKEGAMTSQKAAGISPLNSIRSLVESEGKTSLFIILLFSPSNLFTSASSAGAYDDITDTAKETSSLTTSMAPLTLPEYMLEVVP